ncbi:MAG TPA: peptidylprolyl isomerase, partial [Burkholderiales bacterium]|nr:peptidylprolyl isomerase [Burkholderiales bacterium]
MKITKDTVVSLNYELSDASGKLLEKSESPMTYLHGGYYGIFPMVEAALQGKSIGDTCKVTMVPGEAFGDYDVELVCVEPRYRFPENVKVGMQFEGGAESSEDVMIYTATGIADGKVVVDANTRLLGKSSIFPVPSPG